MKYFTQELFAKINSGNLKVSKAAAQQWRKNRNRYISDNLKRICSDLPRRLSYFSKKINLHDGVLLFMQYGDYQEREKKWKRKRKHCVHIKILHPKGKYIYTLEFTEIRKFQFDYSQCESDSEYATWCEGEWAYEEITMTDDNWIRFEVWMFSGPTVLIEFKNFNYYREKVDSSDYYYALPMRWARKKPAPVLCD